MHSAKVAWPSIVPPIITFSSTDASPIARGVWKVRAIPRPARVCVAPLQQRSVADPDLALLGRGEAADDVQRRRLAAAVRADQAVHLAGAQLEIETVDGANAPKAQAHAG